MITSFAEKLTDSAIRHEYQQGNYRDIWQIRWWNKEVTWKSFLRIHRCYAVNVNYISGFSPEEITLINGEKFSISKTFQDKVSEKLLSSVHDKIIEGGEK